MVFKNVKAYFFDLDGTLMDSKLNFDLMREDLGFPKDVPILEYIDTLECEKAIQKANEIVLHHEYEGAKNSSPIPGVMQFIEQLQKKNYPVAILTRNCRKATDYMLNKHGLHIEKVITREDFPPKPDPSALQYLAKFYKMDPKECIYIGDFKFDLVTAKNAGMQSALFDRFENLNFKHMADYTFSSFENLLKVNNEKTC